MVTWYVYILRCVDNSLYTGVATDPVRRLTEHNTSKKGAKYTRNRRPVRIVYLEQLADRSSACKREAAIKKLSKKQKEELVMRNFDEWFAELIKEADNYESGISLDKESWRPFFEAGMSPKDAIEEDLSNN